MLHQTRLVQLRIDLPKLFDAEAVFLRLATFRETKRGDQLLG
jgi:hypothetical protein